MNPPDPVSDPLTSVVKRDFLMQTPGQIDAPPDRSAFSLIHAKARDIYPSLQVPSIDDPVSQSGCHQGRWWTVQRNNRLCMPVGNVVQGSASLGEPDTAMWLETGFEGMVDKLDNSLVERTA